MRIVFVIRSLGVGGAERQLALLAAGLHARGHQVTVCVTYAGGAIRADLARAGVPVVTLDKRSRWDILGVVRALRRVVRECAPHVVHGYMPTSNLLALAAAVGRRRPAVVWGIRASHMDWAAYDGLVRASFEATRALARHADLIIANSEAGRRWHVAQGYPAGRMTVVPNGIDTGRLRRDPAAGARLRAEWGVPADASLVGLVGRLDPMKDHATFLRACALVAAARPDARFACVGEGDAGFVAGLRELARQLGLDARLTWALPLGEVVPLYSALDLHVSASRFGEGFSNALGEAMACEVPCVSTDVGDARQVLGDTGLVVPCGDAPGLADAMLALLGGDLRARGRAARARIEQEFGVERLVERTEAALAPLCGGER